MDFKEYDSHTVCHEMMIYVRNSRGVTMPLYVRPNETIESIWSEVHHAEAIHDKSLKGKTLHFEGRPLNRNEQIASAGIKFFSVLHLK